MKESKRRTTTETLSCVLTDDELRERGEQLAKAIEDIATEQKNQESIKAEMKSSIATLEARRDALAAQVRRKAELRQVEVEEVTDYVSGRFSRSRLDTGEVIHERPLTNDERQASLEFA